MATDTTTDNGQAFDVGHPSHGEAPPMNAAEHVTMAKAHAEAIGAHAGELAGHLDALDATQDDGDGDDIGTGDDTDGGGSASRAMPAGSAQSRAFQFGRGTGARTALRQATQGRRG